jgi:hypothetical protein
VSSRTCSPYFQHPSGPGPYLAGLGDSTFVGAALLRHTRLTSCLTHGGSCLGQGQRLVAKPKSPTTPSPRLAAAGVRVCL